MYGKLRKMERKILLSMEDKETQKIKNIAIFKKPQKLKMILNNLTWKILLLLSEKEMYPMEIARKLNLHEQIVYYHIRKLVKAGVIKVVKEKEKKGAIAKYYKAVYPALGIELPFGEKTIKTARFYTMDEKLRSFLSPFIKNDNRFDGKIVVGSPEPHGPFKTIARDGHYAAQLAFFLGQYVELPENFAVRLDVDIKAEKEEENNLILVGGPGTNLITQEINKHLPMRFNMKRSKHGFLFGGLISEKSGNVYTHDAVGLIAKISNPWNKEKSIIVLAGNKAVGTKACVIGLTKFWKQILQNYRKGRKFGVIIQGFDLDGDGKVDSVEILE